MSEPIRFRSPEYLAVLDETKPVSSCHFIASAIESMKQAAIDAYPLEACGLLVGLVTDNGWQVIEARQVANLNTERAADRFQLDPAGYQAIDRELRDAKHEIIGVFHSHPDCPARPSPTDLTSAWEGFVYPIVSVYDGKVKEINCWQLNASGDKFQQVISNA